MAPTNQQAAEHRFLEGMYRDGYYPDHVVDKGAAILVRLCERIEAEQPSDLAALYTTHLKVPFVSLGKRTHNGVTHY